MSAPQTDGPLGIYLNRLKLIALPLLSLVLAGCAASAGGNSTFWQISNTRLSGVYRTLDEEAGVVCWVYSSIDKGGIDCMPISETKLEKQ